LAQAVAHARGGAGAGVQAAPAAEEGLKTEAGEPTRTSVKLVRELLEHGANVNLVNHNTQHTALIEACENGHVSVAASLLHAGAQESVGGDLDDAARATLAKARNGHQGSSMDIGRI
jgi:hypothetical protein